MQVPLAIKIEPEEWNRFMELRRVLRSKVASQVFFAIAMGATTPTEIAKKLAKTKHDVSMHIATLRKAKLINQKSNGASDLRNKAYEIAWDSFAAIFYRDHIVEFGLYKNAIFAKAPEGVHESTIMKAIPTITGDGKVGVILHLRLNESHDSHWGTETEAEAATNEVLTEFVDLCRILITNGAHTTTLSSSATL